VLSAGSDGRAVVPRVVLYSAQGCHLCERARSVLDAEGVAYEEVDIGGDAELESRYREWLPVVEIDGERAFVYHVQPEGLRLKLRHKPAAS
jgi:glutaredoxin